MKIALRESFVRIYAIEKKCKSLLFDFYADLAETNSWARL
jgi:hypothetical protein